ncbi:MAG: PAS domain-containing protein [bacterium]|nr:PAS domain-containing protein [bacterium]
MSSSGIDHSTIESIVGDFLLHSTHFGCLVVDRSGRIVLANDTFFSIFPVLSKDQTGKPLHEVVHEQEKDRVQEAVEYLFQHGKLSQTEWRLLSLEDQFLYVDIEASLFESNGQQFALGIFIDRTSKKSLEADIKEQSESLQSVNEQYELAIKTAQLGIWVYDIQADELIWNPEIMKMYGVEDENAAIGIKDWREFIHEEDLEATDNELAKAYAGETVFNVRFRINAGDGTTKHISASAAPVFNADGEVVKIHGVNYDITDLIEAEFEITEREQLLRNITNQFPGFVVRSQVDKDGKEELQYLSDGIRDILGIDPEHAKSNFNVLWDSVCEDDLPRIKKEMAEAIEKSESLTTEICALNNKGRKRYLRIFATPQTDENGIITWDTLGIDITDQKIKDRAIYESQRMLDRLTNQVPGMVYIYELLPDGTDRFEYLSKGIESLFGIDKEEALKNTQLIWNQIHPDDVPKLSDSIQESASGLKPWVSTFRIFDIDGNVKHIQGTGTPTKLKNGTIKWYSIGLDISEQVKQQEKILENKKHLSVISDNFPGVIYTYVRHPDGTDEITYLSKGIEHIHGVKTEDALNDINKTWELMHPDDVEDFMNSILESSKNNTPWETQFRSRVKDGSYRYFQGFGKPTELSNGSVLWSSISFDIHDQVVARIQLKEQKEQLQSITDQISGVVLKYQYLPDGSDRITYISKRVKEYWGVEAEDVIKDINVGWARVVPEDIEPIRESIYESVQDLSVWNNLMRFISKTGEIKYLQGVGTPKKLDNGIVEFDVVFIDITDEYLARKDLETKQHQLEVIGEQLPGVVFTYFRKPDGTDGFSNISDGFEEVYGFDKDKALSNPQHIWDRIHPEDLPRIIDNIIESAHKLTKFDIQFRIIHPNGALKYVHGFAAPTKGDNDTIIWNVINLDITDRKQAETEIVEKQNQLQGITNQIPGVVLRYQLYPDQSEELLYISDRVVEVFGVTKEQAYEDIQTIWDVIVPEDVELVKKSIADSAENLTKWNHVYRYETPDGSIGYLQGFATPTKQPDGSVIWDSVIMDSTQRVMAEMDAVRSSEKLRSFIKASPLAIYQINADGIVTDFWNPAAENIFGWLRKDVIGKELPQVDMENDSEFASIIKSIEKEHSPRQLIVKRNNKFGEELTLEVTAGPFFNEDGELTDLLIIANDITELQEYRKTLEAALKEKDILLQEIHHRVKNNLAIVSGLLELQAMRNDTDHDMSMIIEARNRIHSIAMVHEQLYQDMDFSHIDPREYYRKLLKKLQANTISDPRDIEYDLKFDIDRININRAVPLGLLINELFTNSIKHAFKDGTGKLTLHFTQTDDRINVYYEDDGPGFVIDEIKHKNTIGWQLIETLLVQLDSDYTMDTNGRFMLDFVFTEALHGSQAHFH